MEQTNDTRSKLHPALDEFLASDKTRPQDKHTLLKYLRERPYSLPPVDLVPIHEIEQRLDLAQDVQKKSSRLGFPFPVFFASVCMVTPWEHLPSLKNHLSPSTVEDIYNELEHTHMLTAHYNTYH